MKTDDKKQQYIFKKKYRKPVYRLRYLSQDFHQGIGMLGFTDADPDIIA